METTFSIGANKVVLQIRFEITVISVHIMMTYRFVHGERDSLFLKFRRVTFMLYEHVFQSSQIIQLTI